MMSTRKQTFLVLGAMIALILATLALYMPPFIRSFVGDDYIQFDYVMPFIQNPATLWRVFDPGAVPWYYRPTQNFWFFINWFILGREPFGYYIILLWLHALAVASMVRVARQFGLGMFAALCTAVLLAIHSHWVDVVTWISSVAIVMGAIFSLLSVSAMLRYLARPSAHRLLLVGGLVFLTFFTHEEAILLPPFLFLLLLVWRWQRQSARPARRGKRKTAVTPSLLTRLKSLVTRREGIGFGLMFGLTFGYLILQFTRPNPTVQVAERSLAEWLAYLNWGPIAEFIRLTAFRFSYAVNLATLSGLRANLLVIGLLLLLAIWFWQGNWVVRLGLLWAGSHLFFIYWALWTQLPTLYAGRHIYQAGIGLALAIGATIDLIISHWQGKRWQLKGATVPLPALIIVLLLTAVVFHHARQVRQAQQDWLANVTEEEAAKAQLFDLFPSLTAENHIFAYRFPIAPDFMRSVAQIWYGLRLERPGGGLAHLAAHGRANPDFIVLDYEDGQVVELMPEVREGEETTFLWALGEGSQEMTVVSAGDERRLALPSTPSPGQWTGQSMRVTVPEGAHLRTAVLAQPGVVYRLRLGQTVDEAVIAFAQPALAAGSRPAWVSVDLPLANQAGMEIGIWLEAAAEAAAEEGVGGEATAYWANPRLVR